MKSMRWIAGLIVLVVTGCNMPIALPPAVVTAMPFPVNQPTPFPTPVSRYEGAPPGAVITTRAVGSIPANTPVGIGALSYDPSKGWSYSISTLDETQHAAATDADLAFAPGFNPAQAIPPPLYNAGGYWGPCALLVTTEDLPLATGPGALPAGTLVHVSSMLGSPWFVGGQYIWLYDVAEEGGRYAIRVREDQLAPAPGVDPQQALSGSPTAPYQYGLGGQLNFITKVVVGRIPAGVRVSASMGQAGCGEWTYIITTADGKTATARAGQIEPAPGFDPNAMPTLTMPAPMSSPTPDHDLNATPTPTAPPPSPSPTQG